MSTISTIEFNLTTLKTYNETTQAFEDTALTGKLYTVEGVTDANNQLRKLSMAELVMVVCLARAAEKERAVIDIMAEMENTTNTLKGLTDIEKRMLDGERLENMAGDYYYNGVPFTNAIDFLVAVGDIYIEMWQTDPDIPPTVVTPYDNIITDIESKMDSLNSFSQQKMIELQSETNKRDQAYDMITNILKSMNTVQVGNANNI